MEEKYLEYQRKDYCSYEFRVDEYGNCEMPEYMEKELVRSLTIDVEPPIKHLYVINSLSTFSFSCIGNILLLCLQSNL